MIILIECDRVHERVCVYVWGGDGWIRIVVFDSFVLALYSLTMVLLD